VGMALFLMTLMRSYAKVFAVLVSTLMEKAPCLIPVREKTLAAIVYDVYMNLPSL